MVRKFAAILAVLALLVLTGCSLPKQPNKTVKTARVRYFDGSIDTLVVTDFSLNNGVFILHTDAGRTVAIGANNAIVIEETEEQYNCMD